MKTPFELDAVEYLETPRRNDVPVKIDKILEARMQKFLSMRMAKRACRFTFFM